MSYEASVDLCELLDLGFSFSCESMSYSSQVISNVKSTRIRNDKSCSNMTDVWVHAFTTLIFSKQIISLEVLMIGTLDA